MPVSINGTAGNDVLNESNSTADLKITAGSGNDLAIGGSGNDYIDGGSDNDTLDGGAGNDTVVGGAGDDVYVYKLSQNVGSIDSFDGGSGTADRLQLQMSMADWLRSDVQHDVANALNYITAPGGKAFQFSAFNLGVKNTEYLDVYVDGVQVSAANDPVTARADQLSVTEDDASGSVNLLANDSVPDLVKSVEIVSGPAAGTASLVNSISNAASQSSSLVFTPGSAFQSLAEGQTATESVSYRVTDANGDTSTATATITVHGVNDAPVVSGPVAAAVTAGGAVSSLDALANASDVDQGATLSVVNVPNALPSGVSYDAAHHSFTLDPTNAAFSGLTSGQTQTVTVSYGVADGIDTTQASVSWTVTGADVGPRSVSTDAPAQNVVAADFNGDGKLDLAVVLGTSGSTEILTGDGHGGFTRVASYNTGAGSSYAAAGDLNGDGHVDLVVTDYSGPGSANVLLGRGDGTFDVGPSLSTGGYGYPSSSNISDVNGDGRPDIVVANNNWYGGVTTFLGNGDGTFRAGVDSSADLSPTFLSLGDVNEDGRVDMIVSNYFSNDVTVHLGNGDGTFTEIASLPANNPHKNALADLNGDGKLDIAVANTSNNTVSVFLGNGDGTFGPAASYAVGLDPSGLYVADLNQDGRLDLETSDAQGSDISILLGHGDGTFDAARLLPIGANNGQGAIGDWNGDGLIDSAVVSSSENAITLLFNSPGWFA